MGNAASNAFSGSSLNTLAQNGTGGKTNPYEMPLKAVNGSGTDLSNDKAMKGRAKRKMITQRMVLSIIDIAKKKGNTQMVKALWNTYNCQGEIYEYKGRLYGKYCKNRFCTLCLAIRKAEIINKYLPVIQKWEEPCFVTLTVKSIPAYKLNEWVKRGLIRGFKRLIARYRKRSQREKGIKLMGIKSLECNFNPATKTYNPHLHIIVPNKQIAETLISEWLLLWGKEHTNRAAQNFQKVSNLQTGLIEIVKYGSKIFTEPDVNKKSNQKNLRTVYAAALYNIFEAMKGCRIFERFGFDLPKAESKSNNFQVLYNYVEWQYNPKVNDWENTKTGERLSGYLPPVQLEELLSDYINVELE